MAQEKKDHTLYWVIGGAIGAYFLYEWWKSQQTVPAPVITTPGQPAGTIVVPGGVVPAGALFGGQVSSNGITAPSGQLNINYAISGLPRQRIGDFW